MYTEKNIINESPDFRKILECLQNESAYSQQNTESLRALAISIRPMEERTIDKEIENKTPNCLVDYLWQEIHRLQISNEESNKVIRYLQKIILGVG